MIKWVARLAILTALLGLVGTIIIISNISANKKEKRTLKTEKKVEIPPATRADTQIIQAPSKPDTVKQPQSLPIEQKDTPAPKNIPEAEKTEEKVSQPSAGQIEGQKKKVVTIAKSEQSQRQGVKKKEHKEILFNEDELQYLFRRLYIAKVKNGLSSNCVQLNTTAEGNSKKKLSQVERFLKKHRFTITGREVLEERIKGFRISADRGCLKLIIGSF